MRCENCSVGDVVSTIEKVPYDSLDGVVLEGITVEAYTNCDERWVNIPAMGKLDALLADLLVSSPHRLTGPQFRFLRKYMGWSGVEVSERLHINPATISKWEHGKTPIGRQSEILLRALVSSGTPSADAFPDRVSHIAVGEPVTNFTAKMASEWTVEVAA